MTKKSIARACSVALGIALEYDKSAKPDITDGYSTYVLNAFLAKFLIRSSELCNAAVRSRRSARARARARCASSSEFDYESPA
jgi:hypothetical protein